MVPGKGNMWAGSKAHKQKAEGTERAGKGGGRQEKQGTMGVLGDTGQVGAGGAGEWGMGWGGGRAGWEGGVGANCWPALGFLQAGMHRHACLPGRVGVCLGMSHALPACPCMEQAQGKMEVCKGQQGTRGRATTKQTAIIIMAGGEGHNQSLSHPPTQKPVPPCSPGPPPPCPECLGK